MWNLSALQPQQLPAGQGMGRQQPRMSNVMDLGTRQHALSFMQAGNERGSVNFGQNDSFPTGNQFGMPSTGNEGPSVGELIENMPQKHKLSMHLGALPPKGPNDKHL